jgi:hypothetical protein
MKIRRQTPAQIGLLSLLVMGSVALLAPEPAQAWSKGGYYD